MKGRAKENMEEWTKEREMKGEEVKLQDGRNKEERGKLEIIKHEVN